MSLTPTTHQAHLNGLELAWQSWELGGKTPVLLLHGFLDQSDSFGPLVDALADAGLSGRTVYAPDFRGHGRSGWVAPDAAYHFPDYIFDLVELMDHLEATDRVEGPWEVIGHSMGGSVTIYLGGAHPERLARAVLIEGLGTFDRSFDEGPEQLRRWIEKTRTVRTWETRPLPSVEAAAAKMMTGNPRLSEELARRLARASTRDVDGGVVWRFDPRHRTPAAIPFHLARMKPFIERMTMPVLVIEGAESGKPPDWDERMSWMADARKVTLAGVGHMVHHDDPVALGGAIVAFLDQV